MLGVAIVVAAASGVPLPSFVLILIPLVVLAGVTYYGVVIRPAPTGMEPPEDSPIHEEDPALEDPPRRSGPRPISSR